MTPLPTKDELITLRVATEDLERWRATADAEGLPLSMWIRRLCNAAAVDKGTIRAVDTKEKTRNRNKKGGR